MRTHTSSSSSPTTCSRALQHRAHSRCRRLGHRLVCWHSRCTPIHDQYALCERSVDTPHTPRPARHATRHHEHRRHHPYASLRHQLLAPAAAPSTPQGEADLMHTRPCLERHLDRHTYHSCSIYGYDASPRPLRSRRSAHLACESCTNPERVWYYARSNIRWCGLGWCV